MNTTSFPSGQPGSDRLRRQVLESAITFRNCAQCYWITDDERRQWRRHMRAEALKWRRLGHRDASTRSA